MKQALTAKSLHTNRILMYLVFTGVAMMASCGNKQQQQQAAPPATPVTVTPVREEMVVKEEEFPGNVVPINETELRAEVSGYITSLFVADGASVTKGQRLYEIDRVRYEAAEEQARSALAIAEANLSRIKRDVARYRKLADQDAIARQTVDYAETDLNNAEAQVIAARAALTAASTNLNRSVITAPFSGTVGISQVRAGALVSAGSTLLNTISSVDPIAVDFPVNEQFIQRFLDLRKQGHAEKDSALRISLPGGNRYPHPGQVMAIDRAVDRATGTITVRASLPNPDGALRAGMNVRLLLRTRSASKELIIPYRAVTEQLGQRSVFVVTDSSTAEQRNVRLGTRVSDEIVVTEGLSLGETVVTDGIINLRPGARVTVQQPGKTE